MYRIVALLFVAALALAQDSAPKIDEYVNAWVKQGRFMGSVLAAKGGRVVLSKGYAMANAELDVPNTPQTKFRLGSVTKQFTATAILQLQEQGKLSVEDKISKYVPDAPAAWKDITVHNLLTHTAGVPNYTSFAEYRKKMREPVTPLELIAVFKDKPLDFEPGAKFSYSNSGYALLGYVVEKASGERYEDYLKRHIFEPLDMQASGFDHDTTILKNRATGYTTGRDGKLENSAYLDMSIPYSAGSLYSTVEDLYRWDRALYGEKVLSKQSKEKMFTPFKDGYAYGWAVADAFGRKMIAHGGGINGFATAINRFPADDACVIVLGNHDRAVSGRAAREIAAILFGEKYELPRERTAIQLDLKLLDRYVGRYDMGGMVFEVTRQGDRLMGAPAGQRALQILPESETRFFNREVDAQFTFVLDESGRAKEIILHRGGEDRRGKRVE